MADKNDPNKKYERIIFPCGGEIEAVAGGVKLRKKILTFILGSKKLRRPMVGTEPCNCLNGCPCTVKESGREQSRGWYTESEDETPTDRHMTWAVRCRVVDIEQID